MSERTRKMYNLDIADFDSVDGKYEMPRVESTGSIPPTLVAFNEAMSLRGDVSNIGVHCYIDDYQFERLWSRPERYVPILRRFQTVITPNYSLLESMPVAMQIWNVYRQRMLGNFWNRSGIRTIPSVNFSDSRSFDFCFDGVHGGTISVSNRGMVRNQNLKKIWIAGVEEACRRIKPLRILIYGSRVQFSSFGSDVVWIPPRQFKRGINHVGNRTEYLLNNPDVVKFISLDVGIEPQDFDDFYQETIYKSMTTKDDFDPSKSSIKTWSSKFVRVCARIFQRESNRQELLFDPDVLDRQE